MSDASNSATGVRVAYRENGNVTIKEISLRKLKNDEIRIKLDACGVCGTDLLGAGEDGSFGHEMAGTVLEIGSAVKNVAVGQKVAIESANPCGYCANCHDGKQELCTDIQSFFFLGFFGFAEQAIVPAISALSSDGLDADVATLSEPLAVAIDLVRLSDITPMSNVLVIGQGPIGLMATALVKRAGARRVFVSEFKKKTARIKAAKAFGADAIVDPSETPISKYDYKCPIDRILVTAPPIVLPEVFELAAKGAIVSFIGIGQGAAGMCNFDANAFHFKKLQLRASFASPAMFTPTALEHLRDNKVDWKSLITHTFPLDKMNEALKVAKEDPTAIKVMIAPGM